MAEKKSLSMRDLIAKNAQPQDLLANVPKQHRANLRADLVELVMARRAGIKVPGRVQISDYISKTYHYRVAPSTVQQWLARLDKETPDGEVADQKVVGRKRN